MEQTPRLRSAYPQTPATTRRTPQYGGSPTRSRRSAPLPSAPTIAPASPQPPSDPVIPEHILDAPTQRIFVVAAAVLLWSLRIYDWTMLNESEEQSLWLFMKWVLMDGVFLFGLPGLRIPWLEWSSSTMIMLFGIHAVVDFMLMFRIPIPLGAGVAALGRSMWGAYEVAVNEHNVRPESVRFNDSLILGRQIIHILPEGSAELNPGREAFCIGPSTTEVRLPIRINATNPIAMDLLRTDLDTQQNETIHISKSNIKAMHKEASRLKSYNEDPNQPKTLYHTVKKPGLYVLAKVVDESNLEVSRKRLAHTVIVPCPQAAVIASKTDRCKGEVSDLQMQVIGTPPLTLKYRKSVNGASQEATFENILPEDFSSPMARQQHNALVVPNKVDTAWARSQRVVVPLAESLDRTGQWVYSIDEVRDAFGNRVSYVPKDQEQQDRQQVKSQHLHQVIAVHERPTISLKGCTPQHPMKVAKGASLNLPVQYGSTGRGELANATYHVQYSFSPQGGKSEDEQKSFERKSTGQLLRINQAGLYTLTGVSTDHCSGEVLEPASCLLQNPPKPELSLSSTEMSDKCAGRPIGLSVDLNLLGTPPFDVKYRLQRRGDRHYQDEHERVDGLRGQLELAPKRAGHYTYEFISISDAVYKDQAIRDADNKGIKLEQDVKPSAFARFLNAGERKISCIEDSATFDVELSGEGPFAIEYELVHGGNRKTTILEKLDQSKVQIKTEPLTDGGEYTLALVSVTDAMGCKEFVNGEARISVRHQKPKVGFRAVDGRHSLSTVERKGVQLQLRLEGDGPWDVKYKAQDGKETAFRAQNANDRLTVSEAGVYELLAVRDATCPGLVDETASTFEVSWIPRPQMRIAPSEIVTREGNTLVRAEVCEGDDDAVEVLFKGAPPYTAGYKQSVSLANTRASMADQSKEISAAANVASMRMDTRLAGTYDYSFNKLGDKNYDHDSKHFTPTTLRQKVNAKPSAAFEKPKNPYSFCSVESAGEQVIPITLHGTPPFNLELEIKHHGSGRPEIISLSDIRTTKYDLRIPHSRMNIGKSSVHLRRVSDSNSCIRAFDSSTPGVQIAVHNAPTISELESHSDFCVGERINFALSGVAPFTIDYIFENKHRIATVQSTTFRRLAEKPGVFTITGVQDSASGCKSPVNITKNIHGLPSARISHGRESYIDIHEGGSTEIQFDFGGTPPFEFTYTRSSNTDKGGKKKGAVLDMRSEVAEGYSLRVSASEEGTYEVTSIKDRYCSYSRPGVQVEGGRKRLTY